MKSLFLSSFPVLALVSIVASSHASASSIDSYSAGSGLRYIVAAPEPARIQAVEPSSADSFAQGQRYFTEGNFEQAYDYFLLAFRKEPANLNYNFHLGRAAFETGNYEAAIMAYERILIAQPDSPRVKLELARSHLELGSREMAKQYFREVLKTNPPEPVWRNIQKFLESIEAAERRHFLNGILTLGIQYDDNVSVAPNQDLIFVPALGIPVEVKGKSDWIYTTTAVVNHVYRLIDSPWSWKTTAVNYNGFHDTEDDLNVVFLGLTSGPVRQAKSYLWEMQLLTNQVRLDSDRYLDTFGLGTTFSTPVTKKILITLGATLQDKNFRQDGGRDATNIRVHGGPIFALDKDRLSFALAREDENADDDRYSYYRSNLVLRYDRLLPHGFAGFLNYRFERTKYDQTDTFFLVKRADDRQEFGAGLSRSLWKSGNSRNSLAGQLTFTHTKADSNIALYEYDKNVVTTSLTLGF